MMHSSQRTLLLAFALVLPRASLAATAQELDLESDYMAGAQTRALGTDAGSIEEFSTDIRYAFSPQLTKHILLRLGAEWQRTDFEVSSRELLPDHLEQASLIIGLDCQLDDHWLLRA